MPPRPTRFDLPFDGPRAADRTRGHRRPRCGVAIASAALAAALLGGCYEHVTKSSITTRQSQEQYQPNGEEEGPSILNELMWGPPPKGEDPVKYYRRKNSLGLQQ